MLRLVPLAGAKHIQLLNSAANKAGQTQWIVRMCAGLRIESVFCVSSRLADFFLGYVYSARPSDAVMEYVSVGLDSG